jgi:NADPH:quinone reductase-like Zn-dependent oxidoreductase
MAVVNPRRPEGGAQSELVVAPEASTVRMPRGLSFAESATLPMNGLTAILGLDQLALAPGSTLALTGGAGVLASYAIALAGQAPLRIVADAAPSDDELVRSFGVQAVVPRGDGFVGAVRQLVPNGVDGLFDCGCAGPGVLAAVRAGGSVVLVRDWDDEPNPPPTQKVTRLRVSQVVARTDWLEMVREAAENGVIRPRVARVVSLAEADEAYRTLAARGVRGRLVLAF